MQLSQLQRVIQWCYIQCFLWKQQIKAYPGYLPAPNKNRLNFHDVTKWLIGPATKRENCALLEMITDQRQTPVWFVSHVWNGSVMDFLQCVEAHYGGRDLGIFNENAPYWVCAFA